MDAEQRVRDEWLALRCQASEPGAFEALVAEFERPLFVYLLQLVRSQDQAVELLQEAWIRAFRTVGKLREPSALRAWLYTVARGVAVDHLRHDSVRSRAEEQYADGIDTETLPDLSGLTSAQIRDALTQLSASHREVLILHFLEDFSVAEIAGIAGCPEGTVKSRIHHAKAHLKQILLEGGYGNE